MPRTVIAILLSLSWIGSLLAQEPYRLPPQDLIDIVDAPSAPSVRISADGRWMLLIERDSLPTISDLSRPMLRLAGMRIDPAANGRYSTRFSRGIRVRPLRGGEERAVDIPDGARIGVVSFSHRSRYFAFTVVTDHGTQLWIAATDPSNKPIMVTDRLSTVLGSMQWLPNGRELVALLVPEGRGEAPAAPRVPAGPTIQDTGGEESPLRTYQDLLKTPHDMALFEHHGTTVPAVISVTGAVTIVGEPAMYRSVSPSPSGEFLLVNRIEKPYSFELPYYGFASTKEVWDKAGKLTKVVARTPAAENIPIGGVATGRRSIQWMGSRAATLMWVVALDGGDPRRTVPYRDQWWTWSAPFADEATPRIQLEHRARGLGFFENPNWITTSEYDRDRRWTRTLLHDLLRPEAEPRILEDRSRQDAYGDPGRIASRVLDNGRSIIRSDGPWVYRTGSGASPDGALPFLDRQNVLTLETERLWRCETGAYERVARILTSSPSRVAELVTVRETPTTPPNYLLRRMDGEDVALTEFPDPTPQLRGIHKELVTYKRADGVELSATLYLPQESQKGANLPLLVWAYPVEYSDASTAGQVRISPWRFTRVGGSSHLHLLSQGYAIMDGATIPIIGDPETMNDTFIEQLVAGAQAAIDFAADEYGIADRERVAVGGHSYGAFMTANLLAHCDLFKAGVARSGAYNRTLTPFGFQSERRSLWQAKDVYFNISPFMHANKINEPILLIHGEADNNSGTFPMQSKRLFSAIKGHGGTARLVLLPNESHGYRARESILQVLAETVDWLERHVKNGGVTPASHRN